VNILALYPGLNPTFDEVIYALTPLVAQGHAVTVITSRISALKSAEQGSDYEDFQGVQVHRLYSTPQEMTSTPEVQQSKLTQLIEQLQPDVLFINSFHTLPLARLIRARRPMPTLLRLESADPLVLLQRRYYLGLPPLGRLVGGAKWRNVLAECDAVMTNDPADLPHLSRLGGRRGNVYYAAHCAQQPAGVELAATRDRSEMIYIGSLIRHKNCSEWLKTLPLLFENTPVERFTVIGRGPFLHVVEELRKRFGSRIEHIPGVTRNEALARLSGAWFAYTESPSGWGFLCDAWSTNTPVLCPRSTFNIIPGWTGMMPQNPGALVSNVQRLYDDPDYYAALQEGGMLRYQSEHTAGIVARQYMQIFRDVAYTGTRTTAPHQ
jgi:glycosyltransferase involved in cell wall biosynthesis